MNRKITCYCGSDLCKLTISGMLKENKPKTQKRGRPRLTTNTKEQL